MDNGVDERYAHQLSYDRKYDAVRVLSPRNILTILFGAKTWNDEVYDSHHIQSSKKPHLAQSFPLTTPQLDRLTPTGVKHLEIVNRPKVFGYFIHGFSLLICRSHIH